MNAKSSATSKAALLRTQHVFVRHPASSEAIAMTKAFVAFTLVAAVAGVYLFVNAPPALPETRAFGGKKLATRDLLEICASENAVVRELYTKSIVEPALKVGLKFNEKWRDANVDAGPLPALFLRATAENLARGSSHLGLFLGSDAPVNKANQFSGVQADAFEQMRRDRLARHFFMNDVKTSAAMFPDLAVSKGCVDCHNKHADSPKRDWKIGDLMGATTLTLPSSSVSLSEALETISALRKAFRDVYVAYVERTKKFSSPPEIGKKWPSEGFFLPDPDLFMEEAERRMSRATLDRLLSAR
jgi:adenylate cyclase